MAKQGIPSEKVVLAGLSQGGALTFYTALNTRYKLGGVIGIVTWLPKMQEEPPADKRNVVNRNTPLLHINGRDDTNIELWRGEDTRRALSQAIPDYTWVTYPGGHA